MFRDRTRFCRQSVSSYLHELLPTVLSSIVSRLFKCVHTPICSRSEIHLSVIVVSRRNFTASLIFTAAALRRNRKSFSVHRAFFSPSLAGPLFSVALLRF